MPRRPLVASLWLALFAFGSVSSEGAGTLFLSRCTGNCLYNGGANSACNNTSILFSGATALTPYSGSDDDWNGLLGCVRSVLDSFDVEVTDVDPGCANQWEIPVAGLAEQAGFPNGVLGVAPTVCTAVPNNIALVFANEPAHLFLPMLCNTVVHEFAHLIGVEHEALVRDPMSYVFDCFVKRFTPVDSPCGTGPGDVHSCFCSGALQSSSGLLTERLGAAPGLLFRDGFERIPMAEESEDSTCHWDLALGEETPFAASSPVTPFCATDHSKLLLKP